jgi:hypothetical protein
MSEADERSNSMEVYLNEQRADLEVLRMTVQILLMQLLRNTERNAATAMVEEMEAMMMHALTSTPATATDVERMKQLTKMRGEAFFQRLRRSMGYPAQPMHETGTAN